MKDLDSSPPRKYTYKEWAWFLKLIGEDEGESDFHRSPPVKVDRDKQNGPELGKGNKQDSDGNPRQWSWLGNRSPLMGHQEESEWVLEKLAVKLEKEMKDKRDNNRQKSEKDIPVSRSSSKSKDERQKGDRSSGNHKSKYPVA